MIRKSFDKFFDFATPGFKDESELADSILFDADWYAKKAGLAPGANPARHYLGTGWKKRLDPSPFFNTRFYLNKYPDVRTSGNNPFLHYLRYGRFERRTPVSWFDVHEYCDAHPDVGPIDDAAEHCLAHYGTYAWQDGVKRAEPVSDETMRRCLSLFDESFYRTTYTDIDWSVETPFDHFMQLGFREDRDPSPRFDTEYYRRNRMGQRDIIVNPLVHFIINGNDTSAPFKDPETIVIDPETDKAQTTSAMPSLCVHAHCYYPELLCEILPGLANLPKDAHFVVTVVSDADRQFALKYVGRANPAQSYEIRCVENRGRDLIPFLVHCADIWERFEIVLHIHTKASPHVSWGEHWRRYLFDQLMGSEPLVQAALRRLSGSSTIGMLYPTNFHAIKRFAVRESNSENILRIDTLSEKLGVPSKVRQTQGFAAGSMAFFRTKTLISLAALVAQEIVEAEAGHEDGTLAHALERLLPIVVRASGLKVVNYMTPRRTALCPRADAPKRAGFSTPIGLRWARDTPSIARRPPVPLNPLSRLYDPKRLDIHWIVPGFIGPGAGGHMTIFRMVRFLEQFGHRQTIWLQNARGTDDQAQAKRNIRRWYQPIGDQVHVLFLPDDVRGLAGDILIATDCWTAFPVASCSNFKARFYFIQDHEPFFHPAGENQLMAELTYEFGFACLCAGPWLLALAEARGDWARGWDLAADSAVYHPSAITRKMGKTADIAFYARQYTPRRAVRLGLAALDELHARGVAIHVHLFGEDKLTFDVAFSHTNHGVLKPEKLGDLYRGCDIGMVFSATNYSLIPLEMMSCNLPVVELDGPSTRAVFGNNEVTFGKATPYDIADALARLLEDEPARLAQVERARAFVADLSWEASARKIEAAFRERLAEKGAQPVELTWTQERLAAPAVHSAKPKASVFIPSYNAGPAFSDVLDAVTTQHCDFDYDMLVIDSGSEDGTPDLVRRYADRRVRLERIPKADFQHGRTRNLGISQTSGDYVAILTQDAQPKTSDWLARLIGGFARDPRVAGVIGRHEAYPQHDAFTKRDMQEHFDALSMLPEIIGWDRGLPSYLYPGSEPWRMMLQFYSDNNSAIARSIWTQLPYPEIEWGEDQVWASEMLRLGWLKTYVDDAVVYHSHALDANTQKTAETEGRFWAKHFGIQLHGDERASIDALNARDVDFAARHKINPRIVRERLRQNEALVKGRMAGWAKGTT